MSYTTITRCARDPSMQDRIFAAVNKEAFGNDTLGDTVFGKQVKSGVAPILSVFAYPIAVDYEDEYEYAVDNGNTNPGGDPGVITDANIGSAVQAHWPYAEGEGL
jgi:hypothetical protein